MREQNNGLDNNNKKTIYLLNSNCYVNTRSPFLWLSTSFQTVVLATQLFSSSPSPSFPSSILPSTVDYPLNIMVSFVFSTRDLPSSQSVAPFHPFILSSDALCFTSLTTTRTTPPHPLWSTTPTAMPTYMVSVLSSVASSPLYVLLPFLSHSYATCPNLDPFPFPHAETSTAALAHGFLPSIRNGIPVPPLASPRHTWQWRQWQWT